MFWTKNSPCFNVRFISVFKVFKKFFKMLSWWNRKTSFFSWKLSQFDGVILFRISAELSTEKKEDILLSKRIHIISMRGDELVSQLRWLYLWPVKDFFHLPLGGSEGHSLHVCQIFLLMATRRRSQNCIR